ncbi:MAG: hypothetical protein WC728_18370 [Elusimicrobiota bacterium]
MVRTTLALSLAMLISAPLSAQPKKKGPPAPAEKKELRAKEGPPILSEEFVEHLRKSLKLDDKQRKEIGAVLDGVRPGLRRTWEEMKSLREKLEEAERDFHSAQRDAHERIREKLTYEQRERFDEMRMKMMRGPGMKDPEEMSPEERMKREKMMQDFPPEMWEKPKDLEKGEDLPPDFKEYIDKKFKSRGEKWDKQPMPPPEIMDGPKEDPRKPE